MKFKGVDVELNGIKNVVFVESGVHWVRVPVTIHVTRNGKERPPVEGIGWETKREDEGKEFKPHEEMMQILHTVARDRRYLVSSSGDYVNIRRKPKKIKKSELKGFEIIDAPDLVEKVKMALFGHVGGVVDVMQRSGANVHVVSVEDIIPVEKTDMPPVAGVPTGAPE